MSACVNIIQVRKLVNDGLCLNCNFFTVYIVKGVTKKSNFNYDESDLNVSFMYQFVCVCISNVPQPRGNMYEKVHIQVHRTMI